MTDDNIKSTPEPWLLFPYFHWTENEGILSKYSSQAQKRAVTNFIADFPENSTGYEELLNKHLKEIYSQYCDNGEIYFLDKTPRYYLIIDEIFKVFPNAKFVFLFRNPISIYNSILDTFCNNNFRFFARYHHDIYSGFELLSKSYEAHANKSFSMNYEQLISQPKEELESLMNYLDLDFSEKMMEDFHKHTFKKGSMGDPTGQFEYSDIQKKSNEKWKNNLSGLVRRSYVKSFLKKTSASAYANQGYDKKELTSEFKKIGVSPKYILRDLIGIFAYRLILKLKLNVLFGTNKSKWYLS